MIRTLGSRPLTRVGVISRRSYSTVPPIYSLPVTTPDPNTLALQQINTQLVRMNKQIRFANRVRTGFSVLFLGVLGFYSYKKEVKITVNVNTELDEKSRETLNQAANALALKSIE